MRFWCKGFFEFEKTNIFVMITQNKHWCRLFVVVTLCFPVTEMRTHTFPSRVEGTQLTCACSEPVGSPGALQPPHTVCWSKHGQTRQPWASSSFFSSAETGPWQMLHSLLSHPFAEPLNHAGMKKPLAAQFQKSSGTEGKASKPILI